MRADLAVTYLGIPIYLGKVQSAYKKGFEERFLIEIGLGLISYRLRLLVWVDRLDLDVLFMMYHCVLLLCHDYHRQKDYPQCEFLLHAANVNKVNSQIDF